MKTTPTQAAIAALVAPDADRIRETLEAVPYDALGDDYRSNPEAACKKALRITRAIRNDARRLRAIDRLLGNHGIETVSDRYGMTVFRYSNTGDSYAATVVLFASGAFRVSSWGDIVERDHAGTRYL